MNVTRPIIEHCVDVELEAARKEHEEFHSLHEAYAVTLEEVEEAEKEMREIERTIMDVWTATKEDDTTSASMMFNMIEKSAVALAAEAVQVAAMARKARRLGKDENKTWFGKE